MVVYVSALIFIWKSIANNRIVSWFQDDDFKELFQSIATLLIAGGKPWSQMNAATWAEEACAGICCLEDQVIITPFSTKYLLHADYITISGGQCYGFSTWYTCKKFFKLWPQDSGFFQAFKWFWSWSSTISSLPSQPLPLESTWVTHEPLVVRLDPTEVTLASINASKQGMQASSTPWTVESTIWLEFKESCSVMAC